MKFKTLLVMLAGVLIILIIFWIGRRYTFHGRPTLVIAVSPLFSRKIAQAMAACTAEQQKITSSLPVLAQLFQETFPGVKRVAVRRKPTGVVAIAVEAHAPLAIINENQCLIETGQLVAQELFEPTRVRHLAALKVADQATLQAPAGKLMSFVKQHGQTVCKEYETTWLSPTRIEIQDSKDRKTTLVAMADTPLTPELFTRCQELTTAAQQTERAKRWMVDVRFKNQIILAAQKGEQP